ncbi:MAG: IS200/IS605 family element transposase accessory protein TnpB [Candidatus Aenigmarchaeota archaeon]|nr:IS200/IS605 family element transposase accessory protein TnpB [Candidatus Aenigmarchaeota archaeon]
MFRYRLYPDSKQISILEKNLSATCFLYNKLLEAKIKAYKNGGKSLRKFDMNNHIVKLKRKHPELKAVHSQALQNVSDRVDKAYQNFFRRVKEGKSKAGFPRFKSFRRYKSITYPQSGFEIRSNKLRLSKIGDVKIILHRPVQGKIKTLAIKRTSTGKWFASFSCGVSIKESKHRFPDNRIGIDVGLESFATLSDGIKIDNPRYLIASERRLKLLQRKLSKKTKDSENRRKARLEVARLHELVTSQRQDFLHKLSRFFVQKYGIIAVEDLNIKGMVRHPCLAKHINDASWGTFFRNLAYKAEEAGCEVMKVSPNKTSVTCSQCGTDVPKTLAIRWHRCPNCGLHIHRDLNSARLILSKADTAGTAGFQACGEGSSSLFESSPSAKQEAPSVRVG